MRKRQTDKALLQLLRFCLIVVATTFVVQLVFDKKINTEALTYIMPVSVASYFIGRLEGQKSTNSPDDDSSKKEQPKKS